MRYACLALLASFLFLSHASSQMRHIYKDLDASNEIKNQSFYAPAEGYVASNKWVGYSQDSGHSFVRKYITLNNVDYNGYSVNLTFGFAINGVYAFNKDSILVYGDYGNIMSILFSKDGGNTFKLVAQGSVGSFTKILFTDANTAFAISQFVIWKTTDRGTTWSYIGSYASSGAGMVIDMKSSGPSFLAVLHANALYTSNNSGLNWTSRSIPAGTPKALSVLDVNKVWLSNNANFGSIYFSSNGGVSWVLKNNPYTHEVSTNYLRFLNDTTGFAIDTSFNIIKTTDGGAIWEKLPRDTNFSYLGYTHTSIFFYNEQQFWAGGKFGFLEMTTNAGGTTLPNAQFVIDAGLLATNGTVNLKNYTKQGSGYTYKWYKNTVLLSTDYNASYISGRNYIDTIKLIAVKNGVQDSITKIIDTRANVKPCVATFSLVQSDSSRVAFSSTYQDVGRTHLWDFGDGSKDSTSVNPVHFYNSIGTFEVKHHIYNTISHCSDSSLASITITRVRACLRLEISAVPDTFFTNKITFNATYDTTQESGDEPMYYPANWSFGNGTSVSGTFTQKVDFAKSGTYNTCVEVKNIYTGCVSRACKLITIKLDSCNADFIINPDIPVGLSLPYFKFEGKKLERDSGKAHYWIVNDRDTVLTRNTSTYTKDFYKAGNDGAFFNISNPKCDQPATREINLDSLDKKITHMVYDSVTGCTTIASKYVTVPTRIAGIKIIAVPDDEVKDIVTFYAFSDAYTYGYGSVWRKNFASFSGNYYVNTNIRMCHNAIGTYNYAVGAVSCSGSREVYAVNYKVTSLDSCGVKKPKVWLTRNVTNVYKVTFNDSSYIDNDGLLNKEVIYFGNGDSIKLNISGYTYTYPKAGIYNYTVKVTSTRTGCIKSVTGTVEIGCPRPAFYIQKDPALPNHIVFVNNTKPDTTNVTYLWRFGNGDSSTLKSPAYLYNQPGVYRVSLCANFTNGCTLVYDSLIAVSVQPCNLPNVFKDTVQVLICDTDSVNLFSFFDTTGFSTYWDNQVPQKVGLGTYRLLAVNAMYCADTAVVKLVQDTAIFIGGNGPDWHTSNNWKNNRLPSANSHVLIKPGLTCELTVSNVSVASIRVVRATLRLLNNRKITLTSNCPHLPEIPF